MTEMVILLKYAVIIIIIIMTFHDMHSSVNRKQTLVLRVTYLRTFQITRGWEGRDDNAKGAEGGGEGWGKIKTEAIHYISYLQDC